MLYLVSVDTLTSIFYILAFTIIGFSVYLFISSGSYQGYLKELTLDGHNKVKREEVKEKEKLVEKIAGVLMLLATITFILLGVLGNYWNIAWIVYPIAGITIGIASIIIED